jgi:hypothetical protein
MNCWLVSFSSSWQTMRYSVSVGPPAGNTTMYFTGLFGHSSVARATPDAIIGAVNAPADRMSARRRGRITLFIVKKPPLNLFLAAEFIGPVFARISPMRAKMGRDATFSSRAS